MAHPRGLTAKRDRAGKPGLAIFRRILPRDHGAHRSDHRPPLADGVAWDAGLIGSAGAIEFERADSLQANLLSRLAMDRSVDVVERDREAKKRSHTAFPMPLPSAKEIGMVATTIAIGAATASTMKVMSTLPSTPSANMLVAGWSSAGPDGERVRSCKGAVSGWQG